MSTGTDTPDAQAALDAAVVGWNAAAAPWDAEALAALYTADALFFGGRPGHGVGANAIHAYFKSYEGVIRSARMDLAEQQLKPLAPGCVLAQGFADFSFELSDGQTTRSRLRATLVLRREPDRWRILDHHFSTIPEAPPLGKD